MAEHNHAYLPWDQAWIKARLVPDFDPARVELQCDEGHTFQFSGYEPEGTQHGLLWGEDHRHASRPEHNRD
jgi:hypothetical protein